MNILHLLIIIGVNSVLAQKEKANTSFVEKNQLKTTVEGNSYVLYLNCYYVLNFQLYY